ncbi:MAG: SUMF1/EgtB/PvdO family nonheme iron enzyme [Cyanobium sp.]
MAVKRSLYISSTFADLKAHRAALKEALEKAEYAVSSMESYPAFEERPLDKCLADVAEADAYVLLVAHRYGFRPKEGNPEGKSITQLEYEEACRTGKRPLVFTIAPDHPWPPPWIDEGADKAAVQAFRASVEERHGVNRFTDPAQLVALVLAALSSQEERAGEPGAARRWTAAAIEAWVETHRQAVERQFLAIPAVQDRSLHVDLPVELREASGKQKVFLRPDHLAPALQGPAAHLILLTAEGGAGKTSLAFQIARWGLEGRLGGPAEADRRSAPGAPMLPLLIDTALAEGETVLSRARQGLEAASGAVRGGLEEPLVAELLRGKRLLVIIDHFSELSAEARQRVVRSLPTGLVLITSRQPEEELLGERASTRIQPLQIALDQLQRFFGEVLERKGVRERFSDDDLEPIQRQLRRMVGDKPITPLLALLFIDDVIAKLDGQGVLAASVPELMLGYVNRISEVMPEAERRQAGVAIAPLWVQRGLMALTLASHRQGPPGRPRLQPLSFRRELALEALAAVPGLEELGLREALLAYLLRLRLLHHPGQDRSEMRLALDPLADYLAALRQLELLEAEAAAAATATSPWDTFLRELEARPEGDLALMRGFLLALRDGCQERMERPRGAAEIPAEAADRLGHLAGIDPLEERRRQQGQRARKLIYELAVPEADDRRRAMEVLAAMAGDADPAPRQAARQAVGPLVALARDGQRQAEERLLAVEALARLGGTTAADALAELWWEAAGPPELRRGAAEALGLMEASPARPEAHWDLLKAHLKEEAHHLQGETDQARIDAQLPLLQGASRGLQRLAARSSPFALPMWGAGAGLAVPMLTLTTAAGAVTTRLVEVPVWQVPLPGGLALEVVKIPGGSTTIGSPPGEVGRDAYGHRPDAVGVEVEAQRVVTVPSFAMARYPISQAQWASLAGEDHQREGDRELKLAPSQHIGADWPVESVSWHDAQEWLQRLNRWLAEQGPAPGGSGAPPVLGLPSETLWEVACRAGTTTPFHFGDTLDASWANFDATYVYPGGRAGRYLQRPSPVGAYGLVNEWGLADLHGNVWEWCADRWHPSPLGGPTDGRPWMEPMEGLMENRLLRGGSWFLDPLNCRSAYRYCDHPDFLYNSLGFRVCSLPPGSPPWPLSP